MPEVLEVRPASAAEDRPGVLVTVLGRGRAGDELLPTLDAAGLGRAGAALGELAADLGGMPMLRAGVFVDADLRVEPWALDLPAYVESQQPGLAHLSVDELDGLREVAVEAQTLLDTVPRVCLVHSDLNPKNLILDPAALTVAAVLDWEFAHAGHPFTDLGNLLRFDREPAYAESVLGAYADRRGTPPETALPLARAADLFALVELATRRADNPVAARADRLLRAICRSGDPGWTNPSADRAHAQVRVVGEEAVDAGAEEGPELADQVTRRRGVGAAAELRGQELVLHAGTCRGGRPGRRRGRPRSPQSASAACPDGVPGISWSLHAPSPSAYAATCRSRDGSPGPRRSAGRLRRRGRTARPCSRSAGRVGSPSAGRAGAGCSVSKLWRKTGSPSSYAVRGERREQRLLQGQPDPVEVRRVLRLGVDPDAAPVAGPRVARQVEHLVEGRDGVEPVEGRVARPHAGDPLHRSQRLELGEGEVLGEPSRQRRRRRSSSSSAGRELRTGGRRPWSR